MELIRSLATARARPPAAITIGKFDGIHRGHQEVLRVLTARAAARGLNPTVLSFEPTPHEFFAKNDPPPRLTRFREKFLLLAEHGVQCFACLKFDTAMSCRTPAQFVNEILVRGLNAKLVVVGHDFQFGIGRSGNLETLAELGRELGFELETVGPYVVDGERVSSARVRTALTVGNLQRATQFLGRPYRMIGKVVAGAQLGRTLGFPTANLRVQRRAVPVNGIYAVRVTGAGLRHAPAVASIGTRPVVNGKELLLEVYVFDFQGDLYRQHLAVDFHAWLRDERDFPSLDALVEQMRLDAAQARELLV
jgi:riboflavin kinase/FMN adenylyltransferase